MRRLITAAMTFLGFLLLAPPAWANWVWPLRGEVITPYRNGDDPYASGQHRGIDIAGATGAAVVAAAAGEVRFAGTAGSSGLTVSVRTADGRYDTSYLHLSSTAVREGDRIATGERLGTVGTSGVRSAVVPHLHFGVREAGTRHAYHDPLDFLPPAPPPAAPRGAPAPQPAPAPAPGTPAPAPAPVHAPAGRRVPAPAPHRVPGTAPRRVPAGAPRRVPGAAPHGAPRAAPHGVPRATPHGFPGAAPDRAPRTTPVDVPGTAPHLIPSTSMHGAPGTAPRGGPASGPRRAPARGTPAVPAHSHRQMPVSARDRLALVAPDRQRRAAPPVGAGSGSAGPRGTDAETASGPDLGLLLACLGVLTTAGLLGLTHDGQRASRRTGHRIARALEPLLGRR